MALASSNVRTEQVTASEGTRWGQLIFGIICMVMIANLQYGWTLFVNPIDQKYHWGSTAIQVAFSIFIATETWLVPIEGWFVDRYGPRVVAAVGGVLVAFAWTLNSIASSLPMLYVASAISGVGAGAVYGTCVGNALKWFPDRRGLAAGLTAAGFGAGAAATVIPIREVILAYGYQSAFLWFGIAQGLVVLLVSQFLRAPLAAQLPPAAPRVTQSKSDYAPAEVLRSPVFWLLYVMFVLVSASGLMATAQIAPIAKDFKLADQEVTLLFFTATTLSVALVIDNILNGLARPFFGWVSDHLGRENTMAGGIDLGSFGLLGSARPAVIPTCSSSRPGWCSSRGAKFSACSRPLARTASDPSTRPPTPGSSIRQRVHRPGSCRSPVCSRATPAHGTACSWRRRS